ncbi:MAG: hypothetical protein LBK58_07130 [Prevotellaceae bacterium]|jgi:hypothetical protein|nr:hypothetical protein [Prevotellaceae bacterium]
MKRKSILMTIVAVLFAGMAMGQTTITWPDKTYYEGTNGPEGSDTIFFCARTDSLYPLELGYDVAGKSLHPQYGEWNLISKTSDNVVVADYLMNSTKNGGAGNAYKTVGSGSGGLLFQYESKSDLCGLTSGKKFWVYVFVMPSDKDIVQKPDTLVCSNSAVGGAKTFPVSLPKTYATYAKLYEQAGFTVTWKPGTTHNVKYDSIAEYVFSDTLVLTNLHADYNCGTKIAFQYGVKVVLDVNPFIPQKKEAACISDTLSAEPISAASWFNRNYPGEYIPKFVTGPVDAGEWKIRDYLHTDSKTYKVPSKGFEFRYKDCNGDDQIRYDSIFVLPDTLNIGDWGIDTAFYCKTDADISLSKLVQDAGVNYDPWGVPAKLFPGGENTGSHWYDRGVKVPYTPSTLDYGTVGGGTSLVNDYYLKASIMSANTGYRYMWQIDGGAMECLVDSKTGVPDSGYLVVILQEAAIAQDYTAQLCKSSYLAGPTKFYLNAYTGLDVQWTGGIALTGKDTVAVATVNKNTYKYSYTLPAGCGPGGTGVFYLKVTDAVKVPAAKTVRYCLDKYPPAINLNDVLGVAVAGLTWTTTGTPTGFNATTGILDVTAYMSTGKIESTLEFATANANQCGVSNGTKVTIEFVSNL